MSLVVYTLKQCSTCQEATAWLRKQKIAFEERAIRETPPTRAELRRMLAQQGGELRRLFNTSGIEYRAQGLAAKLPALATDDALALLAGNGSLVKRPFVLGADVGLVGWDEAKWAAALHRK